MEEIIAKLSEKFTKANMFDALRALREELGTETFKDSLNTLIETVKPQKGGGATANPPQEIDGVMFHYCRLSQDYIPESEISMANGKPKGVGKLAAKVAYRIQKASDEKKNEALTAFTTGNYAGGAALNAEADELLKLLEIPANFTQEAMTTGATAIYNPELKDTVEDDSAEEVI